MGEVIPKMLVLKLLLASIFILGAAAFNLYFVWRLARHFQRTGKREQLFRVRLLAVLILVPIVLPLVTGVIAANYAFFIEPDWIKVETLRVKDPLFTKEMERLKIVQLTDLHIEHVGEREKKMVRMVNKLQPDIILLTGDYINSPTGWEKFYSVLEQLKAKQGIYAIIGNTDYYFANEIIVKKRLEALGVHVLLYESARVDVAGNPLWIVGVSDRYALLGQYGQTGYIDMAFASLKKTEPKIVLIHDPEHARTQNIFDYNPQLILCGDTHGGQTGVVFLRKLVPLANRGEFMSGLYQLQGVPLYVNRGIGMKHIYARFLARPEITIIKLESEK